jgi:hypothetical protein
MVGPTVKHWAEILVSFERHHDTVIAAHLDCNEEIRLVRTPLLTKGCRVDSSPLVNGYGAVWKELTEPRLRGLLCVNILMARLCLQACCHPSRDEPLSPARTSGIK